MSYATPQAAQVLSEITRRVELIIDCAKHQQHESTLALIGQMASYVKSASEAITKLQAAQSPAVAVPLTKVLTEHSGCGQGAQTDSLTVRLHPGDKVVLHMGPYSAALATQQAQPAQAGEQAE